MATGLWVGQLGCELGNCAVGWTLVLWVGKVACGLGAVGWTLGLWVGQQGCGLDNLDVDWVIGL